MMAVQLAQSTKSSNHLCPVTFSFIVLKLTVATIFAIFSNMNLIPA